MRGSHHKAWIINTVWNSSSTWASLSYLNVFLDAAAGSEWLKGSSGWNKREPWALDNKMRWALSSDRLKVKLSLFPQLFSRRIQLTWKSTLSQHALEQIRPFLLLMCSEQTCTVSMCKYHLVDSYSVDYVTCCLVVDQVFNIKVHTWAWKWLFDRKKKKQVSISSLSWQANGLCKLEFKHWKHLLFPLVILVVEWKGSCSPQIFGFFSEDLMPGHLSEKIHLGRDSVFWSWTLSRFIALISKTTTLTDCKQIHTVSREYTLVQIANINKEITTRPFLKNVI